MRPILLNRFYIFASVILVFTLCALILLPDQNSAHAQSRKPSDVLNLTNWKITLPIGNPTEIRQPELDEYSHPEYFHVSAAGNSVVFKAHTGGAHTSGSRYPRSELREMKDNGRSNASWSSSEGIHNLYIDQKITHLPVAKPHLVIGQIHDSDDDVIVFRIEGSKLFISADGTDNDVTLSSSYQLGTRFNVAFVVQNNQTKLYYNGQLKHTMNKSYSGAYFKAGAYTQSSCETVDDESCDAYGEVEIYDLKLCHDSNCIKTSSTPGASPTPIISRTPTLTGTPILSPTRTPTATPSVTVTSSITPTNTPTITPTPTISPSPTRDASICDANSDNQCNVFDYVILSATFGSTTDLRADFYRDNLIDINDFQSLSQNFDIFRL